VSEPSDIKQNLADQICALFKWLCTYKKLQSNISSCSWPNHRSDVARLRSRGQLLWLFFTAQ